MRNDNRGGSRPAATSKMERFQPLTIITKRSILDVAAALDPPLDNISMIICKRIFLAVQILGVHFQKENRI